MESPQTCCGWNAWCERLNRFAGLRRRSPLTFAFEFPFSSLLFNSKSGRCMRVRKTW
jgi:hypothetical protein